MNVWPLLAQGQRNTTIGQPPGPALDHLPSPNGPLISPPRSRKFTVTPAASRPADMSWSYRFLKLTKDEVHARRETIDRYALYAQISTLLPALVLAVARVTLRRLRNGANIAGRGTYDAVPHSPTIKNHRRTLVGSLGHKARIVSWWLETDVSLFGFAAGVREQWLLGVGTFCWLLLLCVLETGDGESNTIRTL